jgi:hypothetical protein
MEGKKANVLEKFSQTTKNGKVYASKIDFNLNWILNSNETEESKWRVLNIGVDHFTKV